MRIYFQNGSIPTRAAKRLKEQHRLKESEARRVTSIVLGYRNWADLENLLNKEAASPLDEDCDRDTFQQRRQYQVGQLLKSGLDLKGLSPDDVIARWQPTAARPHTPVSPGTDQGTFNEVELPGHYSPFIKTELKLLSLMPPCCWRVFAEHQTLGGCGWPEHLLRIYSMAPAGGSLLSRDRCWNCWQKEAMRSAFSISAPVSGWEMAGQRMESGQPTLSKTSPILRRHRMKCVQWRYPDWADFIQKDRTGVWTSSKH